MEHTKTPWELSTDKGTFMYQSDIVSDDGDGKIVIGRIHFESNAKHIVKCVNSFDDIITALKKVEEELEFINAPSKDGWDDLLILVKKALAKAEG